jgi:DNA helicase-2/ATP-dependent DNA helicase PcrA
MSAIHLSAEQQTIVDAPDGAYLVIAPPGSGKTRVIAARIRRLLEPSNGKFFSILALTFTKSAAATLAGRLADLAPDVAERCEVTNFHAFCHTLVHNQAVPAGIVATSEVRGEESDRIALLKGSLADLGILDRASSTLASDLGAAVREISLRKREFESVDDVDASVRIKETSWHLAPIWSAYNAALRRANVLDYEDLLHAAYRLLCDFPEITERLRRVYRYVFVDEAQDLSQAQYRVLRALCNGTLRNVMMVADDNQAITRYAGGSTQWLKEFANDFAAKSLPLTQNFRSATEIQVAAARLQVRAESGIASDGAVAHAAQGAVRYMRPTDERREAGEISLAIKGLIDNGLPTAALAAGEESTVAPAEIAVLARAAWLLGPVRAKLADLGIATASILPPQDRWCIEIRWLIEFLRWLSNRDDELAHKRIQAYLQKVCGSQELVLAPSDAVKMVERAPFPLCAMAPKLAEMVSGGVKDAGAWLLRLSAALTTAGPQETSAVGAEVAYARLIQELSDWRRMWLGARDSMPQLSAASDLVRSTYLGNHEVRLGPGVRLLTVHAAKGMEFKAVFVIGLCDGIFPDWHAKTKLEKDDERRSMYVAMTRASRLLVLSAPGSVGARARDPSPYLKLARGG